MTEPFDADAQRWADVHHIAAAVKRHVKIRAYIHNGGTDGCAKCTSGGLTFEQRVEVGHPRCAREMTQWETAQELAASMCDFDLDIAISRVGDHRGDDERAGDGL